MEQDNSSIYYHIKKQFLCCTPINKFDFKIFGESGFETVSTCIQEKILASTVNDPIVEKYPLKKSYQKAFLKFLISKLEKSNDEIHSNLYEKYCYFVSSHDEKSSTHYRHFLLGDLCITLEESICIISQGTTGLCSWQAATGLAEWCISNKSKFAGKRILELGSGIGLTGLVTINTCSPKQYTFSDCHPTVLNLLCKNLHINLSLNSKDDNSDKFDEEDERLQFLTRYKDTEVRAVNLSWEEVDKYLNKNTQEPEIIIASDVLYDESNFSALSNALKILLMKEGCYAVIAATVRNSKTIDQFFETLDTILDYEEEKEEESLPKLKLFIPTDDVPIKIIRVFKK